MEAPGQTVFGESVDDQSEMAVSLSADGNTVDIGANLNGDNGANVPEHVRVYSMDGTGTS